jgi:hypothetical protein
MVTVDLTRCSCAVARIDNNLEIFSSGEEEKNHWNFTNKFIEAIRAFMNIQERIQ